MLRKRHFQTNSCSDPESFSNLPWTRPGANNHVDAKQSSFQECMSSEIGFCQDSAESKESAESMEAIDLESNCEMPFGWIQNEMFVHTGCILTIPAQAGCIDLPVNNAGGQNILQLGAVSAIHSTLLQHWRSYVLSPSGKHENAGDCNTTTALKDNCARSRYCFPGTIPNIAGQLDRSVAS